MDKWLLKGDRNSKFFHASVKASRSTKNLIKLKNNVGIVQWSDAAKGEVAIEYFEELFKSSLPSSFQPVLQNMLPKVTDRMNQTLTSPISKEEVRTAIFSIKSESAPGPDGMTALFFQKYWDIVGEQVTKEIQEVFSSGVLPTEWNYTHICLIPKVQCPEIMADLRPISLCSVLYKAVSKILVYRLQPFLGSIVSINQSAFVSDRLISDNILIAHEAVHALRTHPIVAKEFIAVKTDMSKAYDRVEWSYLRSLLLAIGFCDQLVEWIMMCVTTVTFSVLINDQPFGLITPQRGLRQGDPLSPFLFVLCTEGLSHLLNAAEQAGVIQGLSFEQSGPAIHHLLFADDSLFMCKAEIDQVIVLDNILRFYGKATGQTINLLKSAITFGLGVNEGSRKEIQQIMGISNEGGASKYLGLPECLSGSKLELFSYLRERTQARVEGWQMRKLAQSGKEVLLKSVIAALPVFAMSCFKLPKTLIKSINSIMANYWWNSDIHVRKIHWIAWDRVCLPKALGGMGFTDLECFNQALLAKQAWKLLTTPESLLSRFIKSRYYQQGDFLSASQGDRPSYAWRSLLFGRELLVKGILRKVGNGKNTSVWTDRWIDDPVEGLRAPWVNNISFDVNLMVNDLIDFSSRNWNFQTLSEIFVLGDIRLLTDNMPAVDRDDFWVWRFNQSGNFSVKSAYWLATSTKESICRREAQMQPSLCPLKEQAWKVTTVPKIRVFIWKCLSEALPVADLVIRRGLKIDDRCQICGLDGESINHILFCCSVARQVWALSGIPHPRNGFSESSIFPNINFLFDIAKRGEIQKEVKRSWPWILWNLWKNRNHLIFEGTSFSCNEIVGKARADAEEWFTAQLIDEEWERQEGVDVSASLDKWKPPPQSWLNCNMAVKWVKDSTITGGAWVLRDDKGVVLCHSRRTFGYFSSKERASMAIALWVAESMSSQGVERVVFMGEFKALFGAVNRPLAWPSFVHFADNFCREVGRISEWEVVVCNSNANRGASIIAQSVVDCGFTQSYVSVGHPRWLDDVFVGERSGL